MRKWTFEDLHFIEVDGEVYVSVDDYQRELENLSKVLNGEKEGK